MATAFTNGPTVAFTKETGIKTRSQATVSTYGMMEGLTRATGWRTICMAKASTCGLTVENTKENT